LQSETSCSIPLQSLDRELHSTKKHKHADTILLNLYQKQSQALPQREVLSVSPETKRIIHVCLAKNSGKGAALASGYDVARAMCIDVIVSIDGDGQMDCDEMHTLVEPVARGCADYVKGNRLAHPTAATHIPPTRFIGNSILSILTKIASGYWGISDSQTGYTAINKESLRRIDLGKVYPSYGVPNDILVKLNVIQATIGEVMIKPVYAVGEASKMRVLRVIPRITLLLCKLFIWRLWVKYFIKSLHPLFLLYVLGTVSLTLWSVLSIYLAWHLYVFVSRPPLGYYFLDVLLFLTAIQSIIFAMWMDIDDNRRLHTLKAV
jgi:glycosyltransferase involved in cell wall biosynthesis